MKENSIKHIEQLAVAIPFSQHFDPHFSHAYLKSVSVKCQCRGKHLVFQQSQGHPWVYPDFLTTKETSMACALRRYGVTDSG
jgi:hypothetical protein